MPRGSPSRYEHIEGMDGVGVPSVTLDALADRPVDPGGAADEAVLLGSGATQDHAGDRKLFAKRSLPARVFEVDIVGGGVVDEPTGPAHQLSARVLQCLYGVDEVVGAVAHLLFEDRDNLAVSVLDSDVQPVRQRAARRGGDDSHGKVPFGCGISCRRSVQRVDN